MTTNDQRPFKIIKGAKPATPGRTTKRRVINRSVPRPAEPIEELLERLDQEPVQEVGEATADDGTVTTDPEATADDEVATTARDAAGGDGEPEPDGGGEPATATAPARSRKRRPLLVGVLVAVLAAALAAAAVSSHRWYVDRATDQARQAAVAAARQTTVNFVSVSAASVDRDLQRISAGATGEFKEQFTRGQSQVRQAVVENKVESHGSVLRAGLVSGDRRSAVVLVAVDATVKNVKAPEGRPSHYRIQVDMVRDKDTGEWLVSRLQFVG
ncbi:hypothetical protein JNW88_18275 [Micromonospora sp. ATA32]|nr:hypothetical protein [Micromonospora sp. ATA32]